MRKVCCHECGKQYDFDVDDFCPKCGAFTQPKRPSRIGSDGQIVYGDGLSERNHEKSFLHDEYHEETRERKGSVLEGEQEENPRAVPYWKRAAGTLSQPGKNSLLGNLMDLANEVSDIFS